MTTSRLLIVDDEPAPRRALRRILTDFGHEVADAGSAAEAIDLLRSKRFDAVVTDLMLGDDDGLSICRWVGANTPSVPVVVITGHGSMEAAVGALRVGAYDFLQKPFDPDQLRLTLARDGMRRPTSLRRDAMLPKQGSKPREEQGRP